MTSNAQKADESRPLDGHELDLVSGGFALIELLVRIDQIAIVMGMQVPASHKVRDP